MKKLLGALLVAGGMTACGPSDLAPDVPDAEPTLGTQESKVIVGSVNWTSATSTSGTIRTRSKAVGYLSIPAVGSRCTAWLVSNDVVITNNHCIGSSSEAVGAKVAFNYEDGVASASRIWYDCSTFIRTWTNEDMTALRCKALNGALPGQTYGFLTVSSTNAATGTTGYVIHQNCDYYSSSGCAPTKKYSPGSVKNGSYNTKELSYDMDTLGGSSGSPVLSASGHTVIGLHHVGVGGDSMGRGTVNLGVKASLVKARLAEIGL
ncbi:trypsin-like serine peptidase [Hyalangium gracile]|uniref:trypsin-like serine peptidase n=1 Tax=Hyalangium gracile TaxID=394092 RepID=UPI001CCB4012|nr:trypsin-like peptidase domain-containing protein [Hyalangium gracile]